MDESYTLDELIDQLQRLKGYVCTGNERTGVMDVTIDTRGELREVNFTLEEDSE